VADFVKPCPRRLGTSAPLGRQAPAQPVRVFCQDESRLGLHLPLHRRLTGYGVKPRQVVEPLDEAYWLYAAVEPTTGEAFWWELPSLDAECCAIFLHKFGQAYAERLNIVLLDQAPAHVAQRVSVPDNVVLVWLPAYSPEWNPVERLWEDRKGRIAVVDARIRRSLAALQTPVAGLVQRYTAATIASLPGYASLVEAIHALSF
jgi:putative transposase